jgi:hypothetical protein
MVFVPKLVLEQQHIHAIRDIQEMDLLVQLSICVKLPVHAILMLVVPTLDLEPIPVNVKLAILEMEQLAHPSIYA